MSASMRAVTVVAAVGAGVVGGVFFAFSTFVMRGIRDLQPREAIMTMNSINRAAPTPMFMIALLGTAAACVGLGIWSAVDVSQPGAWYRIAGCAVYLVSIVVTMAFHVPRNDALLLVDPAGPDAASRWAAYAGAWTAWNHVRTVSGIAAAALLVVGSRG